MEDAERWGGERTPSPLYRTGTLTAAEAAGTGHAMGSPLELPEEPDADAGGEGVAGGPGSPRTHLCTRLSSIRSMEGQHRMHRRIGGRRQRRRTVSFDHEQATVVVGSTLGAASAVANPCMLSETLSLSAVGTVLYNAARATQPSPLQQQSPAAHTPDVPQVGWS